MTSSTFYEPKPLLFSKPLYGISEKIVSIHHDKLYVGYVNKMKEVGGKAANDRFERLRNVSVI